MKTKALFPLMIALLAIYSRLFAQDFPIGIWFGGNQNAIDSVHAMGFTWIQAYGGWDSNNRVDAVLQNMRSLNVAAILERNIHNPSFAQRMSYEAEFTTSLDSTRNYFKAHPTGDPGTGVWQAVAGSHSAGYMVQNPDPDDQYFYERCNWVASFHLGIDPSGADTTSVVRLEIANGSTILADSILTRGQFTGTAFDTFEVAYALPAPAPLPPKYGYPVTATLSMASDHNIDVRVYWYDQVNTYLDWVALEDSVIHPNHVGAYQLFRGLRDSLITDDDSFFAVAKKS